ncbi:hypothetical protein [Streptomyces sp. NPDC020667]|uniref:hypothetical protein n=1 Tax=Streptomyces sp. NPDC020667 TaxID=3154895 RepID=UPI003401A27E
MEIFGLQHCLLCGVRPQHHYGLGGGILGTMGGARLCGVSPQHHRGAEDAQLIRDFLARLCGISPRSTITAAR